MLFNVEALCIFLAAIVVVVVMVMLSLLSMFRWPSPREQATRGPVTPQQYEYRFKLP